MKRNALDYFRNEPGVYAIICKHEFRIYVGQSKDVKKRIKTHIRVLEKGKHYNKKMQNDYNKYKDDFAFIPLEYASEAKLLILEQYYITLLCDLHYDLYNIHSAYNDCNSHYFYEILFERNEGFKRIHNVLFSDILERFRA